MFKERKLYEGKTYVRGLHKKPDSHPNTTRDFWWWREGTSRKDNRFLPDTVFNPIEEKEL